MGGRPARKHAAASRHHLASVADAFLSASPEAESSVRPALVLAGPGVGVTADVAAALNGPGGGSHLHDLGDTVGVRLPRWEREGLPVDRAAGAPVLVWCVRGAEAASLVSGLAMGRLAALLEPLVATLVWLPAGDDPPGRIPGDGLQNRVRRLAMAAAPRSRVAVHCVGWRKPLTEDLTALAARFA